MKYASLTLRARRTRKAGRGARRCVVGLPQLNSQLGVEQIVNGADLGADLFRLGVNGAAVAAASLHLDQRLVLLVRRITLSTAFDEVPKKKIGQQSAPKCRSSP